MNLTSPKIIKDLLSKYQTRPNKIMGQNFLIDKNVLDKIVQTAGLKPTDIVLEIGPGIGTLTQELATRAKQVVSIEKDKTMVEILKETLAGYKNVEVIYADILKIDFASLRGRSEATDEAIQSLYVRPRLPRRLRAPRNDGIKNYKIIANIPYYLTSPLIRKFLETENKPDFMVLMVQKEVAQRICSKPPDMSLLSVSVQFYADPKIITYVSKNCFWPSPKVDSAIIKIIPRGQTSRPRCPTSREAGSRTFHDLFFRVVKAGFSHPRKQIAGNLSAGLKLSKEKIAKWLAENKIDPTQRAETLSINDWQNLAKTVDNS